MRPEEKAGLKEIETILHSSAGLYAGVSCTGEKLEKAQMIYEQLLGAITAKKYFDVKFNIANTKIEELSKNSTIADQLKQIREHTENTTTPVSEEAIKQIALKAMQEEKSLSQAESNLANCKQAVASINSDVDLALKNKAAELGCTVEYLENIAKTSPKAFKSMFGIKEQVSFADVNYLQSTRHVNTEQANNDAQEFFKSTVGKADIGQVTAFMKKALEHPEILANVKKW